MNYNYHTHTFRCSHATGTEEEYIQRAIENGIVHMGFSDHIPLRFPDGSESKYRVPVDQVSDYVETLQALREKYAGRLALHIGFEMEYYPDFFAQMYRDARAWGAEYLILGQHFTRAENVDRLHATADHSDPEQLAQFTDLMLEAIATGAFSYIAHPDVYRFSGDEAAYREQSERLCLAAKEANVPLEINFLGLREGRHYPNPVFWEIAGKVGAPVTFGFDAHNALSAYDGESEQKALALVRTYGLNYVGRPTLRPLK